MPQFKTATKRTSNGKDAKVWTYKDFTGTLPEIMREFPMNKTESAIRWRLRQGDSIEKAIDEPAYTFQREHGKEWSIHLEEARKKAAADKSKPTDIKPQKPAKPRHHEEIVKKYMERCQNPKCQALVLKGSLVNGVCCSV